LTNDTHHQKHLDVDEDDVEEIKKIDPPKPKIPGLTETQLKGLLVIQKSKDPERMKFFQLLIDYIEKLSKSQANIGTLYKMSDQPGTGAITDLMNNISVKKKIPQQTAAGVACCLLMQLLRTRPENNLDEKELKEIDSNTLDSDLLRSMINGDNCKLLYDAIFNHMLIVIDEGRASVKD
jgi:hypothetical protein